MRQIDTIVIHCADTPDGNPKYTARDIDSWHAARGFLRKENEIWGWQSAFPYIGYHMVIGVGGEEWMARHPREEGQHVSGHNDHTLGVCLIGKRRYTPAQWETLLRVVTEWRSEFSIETVVGHRYYNSDKTCPGFSVNKWLRNDGEPLPLHTLR